LHIQQKVFLLHHVHPSTCVSEFPTEEIFTKFDVENSMKIGQESANVVTIDKNISHEDTTLYVLLTAVGNIS
jgi:hypothetical protein